MAKGAFNFFELHVEKIVLGVVGAYLLAMVWMYLISSPNRVEFDGRMVGPGELDSAILSQAEQLDQRIRNLKPQDIEVPDFSNQLRRLHESGLFAPADGAPPLAAVLRRSVPFGASVMVPGIEALAGRPGGTAVASVTPLRPDPPVVETGRSMVIAVPASFEESGRSEESRPTPVEKPWVTVAAYFDRKAQQEALVEAGYPQYRARVYVTGVDVQRQELRADGTWSEWQDVEPSSAMPRVNIPSPVIDEATGAIRNRDEIDRAFDIVQANQHRILQPTYFAIDAGDEWTTPPLEGHEPEEEEVEAPPRPRPPPQQRPEVRPPPTQRPSAGGGSVRGGGGSVRGGGGGSDTVGGGGGGRTQARPPVEDPRMRREQEQLADADLKEARDAFREKELGVARTKAQEVINNEYAKKATRDAAEKLLKDVEAAEAKLAAQGGGGRRMMVGGDVGGVVADTSGSVRGGAMAGARGGAAQPMQVVELVTHPTTDAPAVWFHDDSVEAGKTYRYRMRVNIWNRYVGQPRALKNPADAQKAVLAGEWSEPGDPVTTIPGSFFFVKGPRAGNEAASVEVWKFISGAWRKESFDVSVGDVVGGVKKVRSGDEDDPRSRVDVDFSTGAVVLDLRFNDRVKVRNAPSKDGSISYRELQSLVLVYFDPADGQVKEKNAITDKDDPMRKKLEKSSG